jgi:uncharacterized protein (DUF1015 family)
MSHPGLLIMPAHRMVKDLENLDKAACMERLKTNFQIQEFDLDVNDLESASLQLSSVLQRYAEIGGHFGMVISGDKKFYILGLKNDNASLSDSNCDVTEALTKLDVTILRELVLGHGFELDEENSETHMAYTPSTLEAIDKAIKGEVKISFILNPTRVDQMRITAEQGLKMPHKSTYFYPKISSGLVLNVF